ncbi:MAG: DUF1579 family protein [Phycisphaerales bacterium]|jgi:hypothetical protein|nr:DUF1579 family protein [Phycisphaerales bacterium]
MNHFGKWLNWSCVAALGLAIGVGATAWAESAEDDISNKPAETPAMQLPEGWTQADMQACMVASAPGKMQQHLAEDVGHWQCQTSMWMGTSGEPMKGQGTVEITSIMDGRYLQWVVNGQTQGMGEYHGLGFYGFDNVSGQFVSSFMDNHSTGISRGVGKLSEDGKVLTWEYTFSCPITKGPAVMREVLTRTGENTRTWDMYGKDPKTGKDGQMMHIEMERK